MSNTEKSINIKISPPPENNKPFALIWADEVSLDHLRAKGATFSEALGGVTGEELSESAESTGSTPEAADTTGTF